MCCSLSGSIKGVQGERKRHLPFTLGLACGEGLLIFKSYIPSLFSFLFFITEFVALWELRPRDHLRSWKVSFLSSCHVICLILTSGNGIGTSLLTTQRGSMQLFYSMVLAAGLGLLPQNLAVCVIP